MPRQQRVSWDWRNPVLPRARGQAVLFAAACFPGKGTQRPTPRSCQPRCCGWNGLGLCWFQSLRCPSASSTLFTHRGVPYPVHSCAPSPSRPRACSAARGGKGCGFTAPGCSWSHGEVFLTWVCPSWQRCARLPEDVVQSEVLVEDFYCSFCSSGIFKSSVCPDSVCCPGETIGIAGCYLPCRSKVQGN